MKERKWVIVKVRLSIPPVTDEPQEAFNEANFQGELEVLGYDVSWVRTQEE